MDIREQSMKIAKIARYAALRPEGCKACERKGIPILPLRVAVMPKSVVNSG